MTSRAEILDALEQAVALQQLVDPDPDAVSQAWERYEDLNTAWEQENGESTGGCTSAD